MQAIQIKYMPETNTKGVRLKAWCHGGSITQPRDYDAGPERQAKYMAWDLIEKLRWNVMPNEIGTLPNGDWVVTLRGPNSE